MVTTRMLPSLTHAAAGLYMVRICIDDMVLRAFGRPSAGLRLSLLVMVSTAIDGRHVHVVPVMHVAGALCPARAVHRHRPQD